MRRECANPECRREITACNGMVRARDMLDENGEFIFDFSNRPIPKELCGFCAMTHEWTVEGDLIRTDWTRKEMEEACL